MLNCDETDMIVPDTGMGVRCGKEFDMTAFSYLADIIPDVPEDGKCTPGQNYRLDCNTCTCNDDGVIDMCTMKFCDKTKTSLDNPGWC